MWYRENYSIEEDHKLCDFLEKMNQECRANSSRCAWEWLKNVPCFSMFQVEKIGLWYGDGECVASIRLLWPWPGCVEINNRSSNKEMLKDMLEYAEQNFSERKGDSRNLICIINENGDDMAEVLSSYGYQEAEEKSILLLSLQEKLPEIDLPLGVTVKTLQDSYDFPQLSRLFWEGFSYEGPVPAWDDDVYLPIKHAWSKYQRDLCSVVLDVTGKYISFCGVWYDESTQTAWLEPMVTAEAYRNRGMGKACIFHSLWKLQQLGCKYVFVEPDESAYGYYEKLGFTPVDYGRRFVGCF